MQVAKAVAVYMSKCLCKRQRSNDRPGTLTHFVTAPKSDRAASPRRPLTTNSSPSLAPATNQSACAREAAARASGSVSRAADTAQRTACAASKRRHGSMTGGSNTRDTKTGNTKLKPVIQLRISSSCTIRLEKRDITEFEGDAIVNAANEEMLGGGGVDGAIHRAAGRDLVAYCSRFPAINAVRCPTGHAQITPGFQLSARHVIHTVGPVYDRAKEKESEASLELAYRNSLNLANTRTYGIRSIAFPAISCGIYDYPLSHAADVALRTTAEWAGTLEEVTFCLFGEEAMLAFTASLKRLASERDLQLVTTGVSEYTAEEGAVDTGDAVDTAAPEATVAPDALSEQLSVHEDQVKMKRSRPQGE